MQKLNFWNVFALVTGSQIGSSIFMMPVTLAPFGMYSIAGWVISGTGAVALCFVYGYLCRRFPHTGGPHVYVNHAFGAIPAFFVGWTYWIISWISSTALIVAGVSYLLPFLGPYTTPWHVLYIELILLCLITALNLRGVQSAGKFENLLTLLKIVPLIVLPIVALFYFDSANLGATAAVNAMPLQDVLARVSVLTLWGFIGLESATASAGAIENPSITIPRAIIWGTFTVAVLYIINTLALMGLIGGTGLEQSHAPYVDATKILFAGHWHWAVGLMAAIVCIGTLNAWMLASGQIALGLAEDGLLPRFFTLKNVREAPIWGILISTLGIVPMLFMTLDTSMADQIETIVEVSVVTFLYIYLICIGAFFKLFYQDKMERKRVWPWAYGSISLIFCVWTLQGNSMKTLIIASLFTASAIPVYLIARYEQRLTRRKAA